MAEVKLDLNLLHGLDGMLYYTLMCSAEFWKSSEITYIWEVSYHFIRQSCQLILMAKQASGYACYQVLSKAPYLKES